MLDKMSPSVSPIPHGEHLRNRRLLVDRKLSQISAMFPSAPARKCFGVPNDVQLILVPLEKSFDSDRTARTVHDVPLLRGKESLSWRATHISSMVLASVCKVTKVGESLPVKYIQYIDDIGLPRVNTDQGEIAEKKESRLEDCTSHAECTLEYVVHYSREVKLELTAVVGKQGH